MEKKFGSNTEGFANENQIIEYINKTSLFENFNSNFKKFLTFVFKTDCSGKTFKAVHGKPHAKTDLQIITGDIVKNVSVKSGGGNSVHQEPLSTFCEFLRNNGVSDKTIEELKFYHYADGTTDGTGAVRLSKSQFRLAYPETVKTLDNYFNNPAMIEKIAKRTLIVGAYDYKQDVDAFYHGTINNAKWASSEEVLNFLIKHATPDPYNSLHFSRLNYQSWNPNIKRNPKTEDRRHVSQFKWASLYADLVEITNARDDNVSNAGTIEGDINENDVVSYFNLHKNDKIFKEYLQNIGVHDLETHYLVRVTYKQHSNLSNSTVMTRADAYCIRCESENIKEIVHRNNGYIGEDVLVKNNIPFDKIPNSGISVKLDRSTKYSLLKLTPNSFKNLFGSYELGAGASIFCLRQEELPKNVPLFKGWNTSIDKMIEFFKDFNLQNDFYLNMEICKQIKSASNKAIKTLIDNNEEIRKKVFNGIGLYSEPYTAKYFYKNKKLSILESVPYSVTTGSGRTKGKYSIELKPS